MPEMQDDDQSLVDQKALREIIERATEALRPIGLTLLPGGVQAMVDPQTGTMMLSFATQIRPKAATQVVEDLESRKEFNRLQAERHDEMIAAKAQKIRDAIMNSPNDADALSEIDTDTTSCPISGTTHRLHPSTGHCLDCGFGLDL